MERVPTQTDLVRLCDAADSLVEFHRGRITQGIGTAEDFDCEIMLFYSVLRFLPYPKHFEGLPFDVGMWSTKPLWQGWTDEAYDMCMGLVVNARMWTVALGNFSAAVKNGQQVNWNPATDEEFENQINQVKHFADLLRTLCQFIPCEQQIDILSALEGKSHTAEQLVKLCNIPKSRLYGKRDDKTVGGLNELMRLDLVRNGSKDDSGIKGYYRPDRPPE